MKIYMLPQRNPLVHSGASAYSADTQSIFLGLSMNDEENGLQERKQHATPRALNFYRNLACINDKIIKIIHSCLSKQIQQKEYMKIQFGNLITIKMDSPMVYLLPHQFAKLNDKFYLLEKAHTVLIGEKESQLQLQSSVTHTQEYALEPHYLIKGRNYKSTNCNEAVQFARAPNLFH